MINTVVFETELDCLQSHAASHEILEDEDILTELDISDDHENGQVRILQYQTDDQTLNVYDGTDTGVTVDFNESLIRLKKVNFRLYAFFTGPPTRSVGGQTSNGRWCLSSSVGVCNTPRPACSAQSRR